MSALTRLIAHTNALTGNAHHDPILHSLLTDEGLLSARLQTATNQLQGMLNAGELADLPSDTRTQLAGLLLFLTGAAQEAREAGL